MIYGQEVFKERIHKLGTWYNYTYILQQQALCRRSTKLKKGLLDNWGEYGQVDLHFSGMVCDDLCTVQRAKEVENRYLSWNTMKPLTDMPLLSGR